MSLAHFCFELNVYAQTRKSGPIRCSAFHPALLDLGGATESKKDRIEIFFDPPICIEFNIFRYLIFCDNNTLACLFWKNLLISNFIHMNPINTEQKVNNYITSLHTTLILYIILPCAYIIIQ